MRETTTDLGLGLGFEDLSGYRSLVPDEGHPKETRQNRLETGIDGERRRDWTVTRTHIVRGDREDRVEEGRVGRDETRTRGGREMEERRRGHRSRGRSEASGGRWI